jgi:hypothetical protein
MIFLSIVLLTLSSLLPQKDCDLQEKANKLKYITDMPYICEGSINTTGCGQVEFWDMVKEKNAAIPMLLSLIDDTTTTKAIVSNFGGNWTVGDIAYCALEEIIHGIPTFELLGVQFDYDGCGYCSYWSRLRDGYKNRKAFKHNVFKWYRKNKAKLVWIENEEFATCDCNFKHPNGGHYEIRK